MRIRRKTPDADTPPLDGATPPLDGADAPVESLSEDRLGRRSFAEALAAEVMAAPVARGYVMGLTGAWGTGKTPILNRREAILERLKAKLGLTDADLERA